MMIAPTNRATGRVQDCSRLDLLQNWLPRTEEDFRPGHVNFSWTGECLLVEADLEDDDVFNQVTGLNEYAFQYGDVVEVFIVPDTGNAYYEIHAAPSGAILQLAIDDRNWRKQPPSEEHVRPIWKPVTRAKVRLAENGWCARLEIPFRLLGSKPNVGDIWGIAACRYDYTRGRTTPVLSSTAPLPRADFHLIQHYNTIRFEENGRVHVA